MSEPVTTSFCREHGKLVDERFERDMRDIQRHENMISEIQKLTLEISALVKQNDELVKNHEQRLAAVEKKPSMWLERILSGALSVVVSAITAALFSGKIKF
ncbi:MAG: hypothetical protein E7397_04615 [Ruminococcaceae bacterium]|nr:hypothetical protein [Oscillospiraceae bacterium]